MVLLEHDVILSVVTSTTPLFPLSELWAADLPPGMDKLMAGTHP
ncbi:hypothetical protein FHS25_006622 [Rhizobium laguerreae]|uniref:Uncharacterized protein n=1 Tax=Rhizobium laguerreae TaxID=1076926 RepID=A0ABR6GIQ5_9HYPH|nr:hypothetical protein [Rhizobium laguerreae]